MGKLREYREVMGVLPAGFREKLDRVMVVRDEGELWADGVGRLLMGGYDVVCRGDGRMLVNGSMMWIRDGVIMVGGWSVGEFMRLRR